jgi:7-cyano-7-deazaguanine synthase in queuosine biosynthesis
MCEYREEAGKPKTATIVMLSGGADSVGLLYRLLQESSNHIIAHHIHFINAENRYNLEAEAVRRVREYLSENARSFEYIESTLELPFKHCGWDIINAMYLGGVLSKSISRRFETVQLCIGDNKDDFGAYKWRSPIAQSVALLAALEDPRKPAQKVPQIVQPVVDLTKAQLIAMMPEPLFAATWSCRRPLFLAEGTMAETCGTCITCVDLKNINAYVKKRWELPNKLHKNCS